MRGDAEQMVAGGIQAGLSALPMLSRTFRPSYTPRPSAMYEQGPWDMTELQFRAKMAEINAAKHQSARRAYDELQSLEGAPGGQRYPWWTIPTGIAIGAGGYYGGSALYDRYSRPGTMPAYAPVSTKGD